MSADLRSDKAATEKKHRSAVADRRCRREALKKHCKNILTKHYGPCYRFHRNRTTAVTSLVRMTGSGNTTPGQPAATTKKQTQTNPLRLSRVCSERCTTSEQNEPIEVKIRISNCLRRKKARFSRNMDGTPSHYSQIEEKRQMGCGRWQGTGITFKAGMLLIIGDIRHAGAYTIPNWEWSASPVRRVLSLFVARRVGTWEEP